MTYLYNRIAATRKGARALSSERLKYQILKLLHASLATAGITQVELAKRLGVRKSAVNAVFKGDGNLRISTLAEYLHVMDLEVALKVLPLGTQRTEAMNEITHHWKQSRSVVRVAPSPIPNARDEDVDVEAVEWRSTTKVRSSARTDVPIVSVSGR